MEKVKVTYQVYNFEELSEDIKQKLIQEEKENQKEFFCQEFLKESMEEEARRLLQKYFKDKATFKGVYYDLSYCQGSGSMIEYNLKYYNEILEIKQYGHYSHENSFRYDSNLNIDRVKKLNDKIYMINEKLTKYGYNLIEEEAETSDIIEILKDNKYLKNGEVFSC